MEIFHHGVGNNLHLVTEKITELAEHFLSILTIIDFVIYPEMILWGRTQIISSNNVSENIKTEV